ncbi:MAG: hypothetical protein ACNS62_14420 [Candidatus Cyclobacteriaceae bacterium M3_2C_046]
MSSLCNQINQIVLGCLMILYTQLQAQQQPITSMEDSTMNREMTDKEIAEAVKGELVVQMYVPAII